MVIVVALSMLAFVADTELVLGIVSSETSFEPVVFIPAKDVPLGAVTEPDMVIFFVPSAAWLTRLTVLEAISTQSVRMLFCTEPVTFSPFIVREYVHVPLVATVNKV